MKLTLALGLTALCTWPTQGAAQQLYRCGNTYSQTPCAPDATPARISAGAAPEQAPGASGKDLCVSEGVAQLRFPDPESTRIQSVAKSGAEVIQYAGKPNAGSFVSVPPGIGPDVAPLSIARNCSAYVTPRPTDWPLIFTR